jgi:thymidylate synthase (FAD)
MTNMEQAKLVKEPTIFVLAEMALDPDALPQLLKWLEEFAPGCLDPEEAGATPWKRIFPHDGIESSGIESRKVTDNELLVELSGRKCYNSFGLKAGRRSNAEYVSNLFGEPGKIPHASVLYHAKMTFFFGGIGRRVSHELIRHYVGADRDEEGSPSQESTRFTHHSGHFSLHPRDAGDAEATEFFLNDMNEAYSRYHRYLKREVDNFKLKNGGAEPKGMDRKRIYEAAAQRLPGAACTSFTWTTNPMALAKLFEERCDYAADLEIQRFAKQLRVVCYKRWPNLFKASNPAYGKAVV